MIFFTEINNENELVDSRHCWLNPFDSSNQRTFILLIGMRGIGKTTLGNIMNKWYILDFVDMDEYFFKVEECTISEYVARNGWNEFRKQEIKHLIQVIEVNRHFKTPNTSPLIISCGGGIITTEEGRSFLFELKKSLKVIIIHIRHSDMDKWILNSTNIMTQSSHRPHISTPINQLWQQRRQYYQDLSHADYILDSCSKPELDIASEFIEYINLLLARPLQSKGKSHFSQIKYEYMYYCLSFGSVLFQSKVQDIMSGIDAVEYRADLIINNLEDGSLWNHLSDFRRTISHSLPLCFSIRSIKHGGKYPASLHSPKDILKQAISFGCSWIDMEWDTLSEAHLEELLILCNSKHIIPIISYHGYIEYKDQWTAIYDAISSFSNSINKTYKIETILIKIISWCDTQDAVSSYFSWIKDHQNNSLIAHCTGNEGRDTRIYQSLFSPLIFLTIPNTDSTASGQYTVNELNQIKTERGYILPKNFYLFGSPIQHSLSPSIHNSAFRNLGLPFTYSKHDVSHAPQATIKILDESNKLLASFGGASITAPLKQTIYDHFERDCIICPCVSSIKVVNTLTTLSNDTISMANTDWIAMFHLMNDRILSIRRDIAPSGSFKISHNAILLGLGATAQSSIFALDRICIPPDRILLWNRTKSLISSFIKDFQDTNAELLLFDATNISSIINQSDNITIHLSITSSLPLEQDIINNEVMNLLEQYITMLRNSNSNIFITLVEWNYTRSSSPLLDALYKIISSPSDKISLFYISGKSLLLEQAIYQSYYWTGMTPPRNIMNQSME